jgi:molybdenum ABC transporter molybdate-binding protein
MRRSLVLLVLALVGCAVRGDREAARDSPLVVAAPASLKGAFEEIAQAYRERHAGAQVVLTTAAPEELMQAGAPLDVIAGESPQSLAVVQARLVERRDYASNPLVLVEREGAPRITVKQIAQAPWAQRLALADGRGDTTGAAAEATLGRLGVRRELDGRLLYVARAPQVIDSVLDGRAELGLVRGSDAVGKSGLTIAERLAGDDARYPIAIVAATPRLAAARDFLDEVLHGAGPQALAAHGVMASAAP